MSAEKNNIIALHMPPSCSSSKCFILNSLKDGTKLSCSLFVYGPVYPSRVQCELFSAVLSHYSFHFDHLPCGIHNFSCATKSPFPDLLQGNAVQFVISWLYLTLSSSFCSFWYTSPLGIFEVVVSFIDSDRLWGMTPFPGTERIMLRLIHGE